MTTYVCESDLDATDIEAGEAAGLLIPWRRDSSGALWFKCLPGIRGIPESESEVDDT